MSTAPTQGSDARAVLVTGASGYIGKLVVTALAENADAFERVVAVDVREPPSERRHDRVTYAVGDVTDRAAMVRLVGDHRVDAVVHLAAVVTPRGGDGEARQWAIDVEGTRNVVAACLAGGVGHLVYTSSGAAYGYWPDNPPALDETAPLRGNDTFAYSRHKRIVEEELARCRDEHPELAQLIFRPGTILGETVSNQITAMFERPLVVGVLGSETPFVFVWDGDVVGAIVRGLETGAAGVYNLAGDGVVTLPKIARRLGKTFVPVPAFLLSTALAGLSALGLSPYGPEQVDFLRYRPVLDNTRLKEEFGYRPQKTSSEVFELYADSHRAARAVGAGSSR